MDKMSIKGGAKLQGEVSTSGAKNSALALMFATLVAKGKHVLHNVPELQDIQSASVLLESLGATVVRKGKTVEITIPENVDKKAHYDLVRKMRASILCLGPLLARWGEAVVSMPGGCAIGARPIDMHLQGFKTMGAEIILEEGYVVAKAKKLKGANVLFDFPTVGGTENIMMGACLADGETVIENAAKEPEIIDLAQFLKKMGAKISGEGTSLIRIQGVDSLRAAEHEVIPDRIEAGTLLIAGAITNGEVTVKNCMPMHLEALTAKFKESGIALSIEKNSITVKPSAGYKAVDISTSPHPGFPTDLQAQFMTLMTNAVGTSVISETVFENRFMHVQELLRLNAKIKTSDRVAVVMGNPGGLIAAPVMATDLRASASLVLAGLVAKGETVVSRIYHLDRGYEKLELKLSSLGGMVKRTS